ncbi:hypothetical protein X975_14716, partial [Stegodyphus mimosarum]
MFSRSMMLLTILFSLLLGISYGLPISLLTDGGLDLISDYQDTYNGPYSLDYKASLISNTGLRTSWPFDRYGPLVTNDLLLNSALWDSDLLSRPAEFLYSGVYPRGVDVTRAAVLSSDLLARPFDYLYRATYPKTVDFAKENYVKDSLLGGTEVGVRDSIAVRPGFVRSPYSRYYTTLSPFFRSTGLRQLDGYYYPYSADYNYRQLASLGVGYPRPASLRWGGDQTILRR